MSNKPGYTPKELLLQVFDTNEKRYKEITRLDEKEMSQYKEYLARFNETHDESNNFSTVEKGKSLESLVGFLLARSAVFEVHQNLRNSTNEIDQLLILNSKGNYFKNEGLLNLPGEHFLSECKNYQGKIGVTWIGKLYSLIESTNSQIGLIFSYHGITGDGWKDATGLVKKLYLRREDINKKVYILDFNIKDFNSILDGHSILELIDAKVKSLKFDTDLSRFIEKHPAEE
ncbi:acetylglutamate semialdehyde dehydrogenase [Virgibacillus alimentarius]|uniref:Restriction endonuclease type IV Mrr domain-containing protein n=1 Tax=Virgibacillus alimentarius TaxID=698769 RepID=A0ABS4S7N0_9BACI|nr:acetylglutamate semialdehyde dehydrogenase [Virgibacillus alimentarius]MBP2257496.1 hypothetical protein [Virgibacillus alimentarius]MBT2215705.1 acetylglutamate semialdehyde dehydrogenase [Virgibacillus dakarensis]